MRFKRRKNFLATFFLAILFWGLWGWLVYSQPPTNITSVTFFILLFSAVFLTTALVLANSRRGFLLALLITLALIFRYFQIGNLLNLSLLASIFITLEIYLNSE